MCPFLQKLRKEEAGQSGGEEEPEEESHTPLPPPMQIIKDPNNPEVNREKQTVSQDSIRCPSEENGPEFIFCSLLFRLWTRIRVPTSRTPSSETRL